jgi:DNA-directed RNA polymerase subunit RPC12/RpoP
MTVRVFWDRCDKCSAAAAPDDLDGGTSCPVCSGEGFRKYRVLKDSRSGLLYYRRFDAVLLRFQE